jgi:hypothetical protein
MVEGMKWTPEPWAATVAALHSRSSVSELLAMYEDGAVTSLEVFGAVWAHCHDKPGVTAGLLRVLREHPSEVAQDLAAGVERMIRARPEDRAS